MSLFEGLWSLDMSSVHTLWVLLPVYASDSDVIPEKSLLHLCVSPAVVSISYFKSHVNKTVIERALRPPVSSYLHFGNMHKSCLFPLVHFLIDVWVCALNRSYNCNKDSWPDNSKLQTLFSCFLLFYFSSNIFSQGESRDKIHLLSSFLLQSRAEMINWVNLICNYLDHRVVV